MVVVIVVVVVVVEVGKSAWRMVNTGSWVVGKGAESEVKSGCGAKDGEETVDDGWTDARRDAGSVGGEEVG